MSKSIRATSMPRTFPTIAAKSPGQPPPCPLQILQGTAIPRWAARLEIYGFYPLGLLALLGLVTLRARRAPAFLWLVPLLLGTTVFVTSFIRFRCPLDPFLVMLAALALGSLRRPRRAQRVGLATK